MAQEPLPSVTERLVQLGQTELLTNIPFRQCLADFVGVNLNPTTRTWLQGQGRLTSENRVRVAVFLEGLNKPARDLANLEPGLRIVANAFAFELLSAQKLMEALQCTDTLCSDCLRAGPTQAERGKKPSVGLLMNLRAEWRKKRKTFSIA